MLPEFDADDVVDVEVIEHPAPATDRSVARRIALQVLYELDTTNHKVGDVIETRLGQQEADKRQARYVRFLVLGIVAHRTFLDDMIRQYAAEWPLELLAAVDRNILRMALFEFGIEQRVPVSVAIDEAVGLARLFGSEASLNFVNGVLGKVASDAEILRVLHAQKTDDGEKIV